VGSLRTVLCAAVLIATATLLASPPARAQVDNGAIAEELFNDAKKLLDQGKPDLACPKFAESLRLSPTLGTRLNLAHCYEVQGRTATAWSQYKEVVRTGAGDTKRATIAVERIAALEPHLSRVLLSGSAESGLKIKLDNDALDTAVLGTAFPIDPGDHTVELTVAGKKTRVTKVHIDAGKTETVEIAPLESATTSEPVTPTQPVEPPHETSEVSKGKLIGGWVAISGGAIALGVGIAFGVVTLGLASDVRNECPNGPCPTQDGLDKNSAAHTDALLADILIPVGVVAAGIGTWLVATASHRVKASSMGHLRFVPLVSGSGGGMSIGGSF
jgi:hypothetical protein